jgi:hypothetical protein
MSEKKPALKDRVSEKMGMAAWMHELYYQNASMFISDPRWKQLPPYLQTSGVSSTFIALKSSLDKIRESKDAKGVAKKLEEISNSEQSTKVA